MTAKQAGGEVLKARLDEVAVLLQGFDGSAVTRSLIRRAVLKSILHLPPNHEASEALELFYLAMDQAIQGEGSRKSRTKTANPSNLNKIWSHARKAIETVTRKSVRNETTNGTYA